MISNLNVLGFIGPIEEMQLSKDLKNVKIFMIHEQLKKDAPGKTCKGPEEKACWKKDMKRLQWLEFDEGVTVETKVE